MVPSSLRSLHLRAQISPRLMLLVRANSMAIPSGRGPPLPDASCGCSRHDRGHLSASSRAWTACGSCRGSWDGAIAAATARAGRLAPLSSEAVGPLGALAACHDKDAVERRLGDARGLPGLRTPRVSAEGTLAGRPLVVCSSRSCRRRGCAGGRARAASTGTTRPGASSTRRGRPGATRGRATAPACARSPGGSATSSTGWATGCRPRHNSPGI